MDTESVKEVQKKKAVVSWSGGKDSAHALYKILQTDEYEIVALLTTINRSTNLSTMHNIPLKILEEQSKRIGIPLKVVELKPKGNLEDYSQAMETAVKEFKAQGVTHFIFGDIFLDDIRSYREQQLKPMGICVVEPLWGKTSKEVMDEFLESGLKTIVVTTMADGLGMSAIGQLIDQSFVDGLSSDYDPNGEHGEYHTFCYDGPIYSEPVPYEIGSPFSKSFDIGLDDGTTKTFTYCFVDLKSAL